MADDPNAVPHLIFSSEQKGSITVGCTDELRELFTHFIAVIASENDYPHAFLMMSNRGYEAGRLILPGVPTSEHVAELLVQHHHDDGTTKSLSERLRFQTAIPFFRFIIDNLGTNPKTPHVFVTFDDNGVRTEAGAVDDTHDWGDDA